MRIPLKAREVAPRLTTGLFILNAGLGKRHADEQTAKNLHGMASGTYSFLAGWEPLPFVRTLSTAEIAVGAVLLTPLVPAGLAGAVLTGFAGGMLGLYLRTPGMRKPGSLAPTQQGTPISKDVWMLGIGLGLMTDAYSRRRANS